MILNVLKLRLLNALKWASRDHRYSIVMIGVIFLALSSQISNGAIAILHTEYPFIKQNKEIVAIFILTGTLFNGLSKNLVFRWIGLIPYTFFTILLFSLWFTGKTTLLQSQTAYFIIGTIMAWPLVQDTSQWIISKLEKK